LIFLFFKNSTNMLHFLN